MLLGLKDLVITCDQANGIEICIHSEGWLQFGVNCKVRQEWQGEPAEESPVQREGLLRRNDRHESGALMTRPAAPLTRWTTQPPRAATIENRAVSASDTADSDTAVAILWATVKVGSKDFIASTAGCPCTGFEP